MWKNTRNVFYKTRVPRVKLAQKEMSIVASVLCQQQMKRKRLIILARKGISLEKNIDHSNSALAATDKIYVYILCSKRGKTPEMFSTKRVRFVILARKGISIVASVLWQQHTIKISAVRSLAAICFLHVQHLVFLLC